MEGSGLFGFGDAVGDDIIGGNRLIHSGFNLLLSGSGLSVLRIGNLRGGKCENAGGSQDHENFFHNCFCV